LNKLEWDFMNEMHFDAILQNSLSEPPPDDVVKKVTPWRRAMNRILVGLALNTITLNFWALNFVLPAVGLILMLLGFRTLSRENGWFRGCFFLTIIRAGCFFPPLILNATIFESAGYGFWLLNDFAILPVTLALSQYFCLWRGFITVQRKVGVPAQAGGAVALMLWYLLICLFAFQNYSGLFIGIILIAAYIFIIRSLFKLSMALDEAGYAIQAAPVRVPDWVLAAAILAAIVVGITCGYLFGGSYPMEWRAVASAEQPETDEIKAHLIELGFPEAILQDLTAEDIRACKGALQVVVDAEDHAANDGRKVIEQRENRIHNYTVYDTKELRITGVAVKLPGEREQWKIFHHFLWIIDPGFYGTEAIQLWPAYRTGDGWEKADDVTGQVLYTSEGQSYAAPYYSLGSESYSSSSIFWGMQTSTDIFAAFSMPGRGEKHRGYVSYTVEETQENCHVNAWINYTHQLSWLQYPALTAKEQRIANSRNRAGAFITIQDALQFYPAEEGAD